MATAKEGIKQKVHGWSHHDSADLYGIDDWGNGYFRISKKGEVTVRLNDEDGGKKDVSLCDLLEGLKENPLPEAEEDVSCIRLETPYWLVP